MCPLIKNTGGKIIRNDDSLDNTPFFGYNRAIIPHDIKTKLLKEPGKFRRGTIKRINEIFETAEKFIK